MGGGLFDHLPFLGGKDKAPAMTRRAGERCSGTTMHVCESADWLSVSSIGGADEATPNRVPSL